jgi:hypothetical protein
MYTQYMHGIDERHDDRINRTLICNYDRCNEQMKDIAEQILTRTTRISLTIRHVEKTSKLSIGNLRK